jgi:ribosome-binding factor A
MNERRIARLQEQLKQRLAEILQRDLADPHLGLVTITRVELDTEFTQCRAYWSVLGDARARRDSEAVLRRARGFCQREMGKGLHTRTVPTLEFVFDDGIAGAIRVNELLRELRVEREARDQRAGAPDGTPPTPAPPATDPRD